jgi:hypothetical protein
VQLDMEYIAIVPVEPRNDHATSVA